MQELSSLKLNEGHTLEEFVQQNHLVNGQLNNKYWRNNQKDNS